MPYKYIDIFLYKVFPFIMLSLLLIFSISSAVSAAAKQDDSSSFQDTSQSTSQQKAPTMLDRLQKVGGVGGYEISKTNLPEMIANIVKIFLGFLGAIFVGLMLYAGYLWMTAGGNEDKVTKAKDLIKRSIIGLAIVLAAYSITYFIFKYFQAANGGVGSSNSSGVSVDNT